MRKLLVIFVTFLLSAIGVVPALGVNGNGCEQDSPYQTRYSPGCFLEHPDESKVLTGISFQYVVASCPSPWGSGTDSLGYIYIEDIDPSTGNLESGKTYDIELFFSHDCRAYAGAYQLDLTLSSSTGDVAKGMMIDESYYSYESSRVSSRSNYCLFYSCGRSTYSYELTTPVKMSAGTYSLRVDARTVSENNSYGFSDVQDTFNFSSAFGFNGDSDEGESGATSQPSPNKQIGLEEDDQQIGEEDEKPAAKDSQSDRVLNAGSFKGYVALYAKGYKGERFSAKVGKDWVVVPSLESDFERIVEYTGAGYTINVRMYINSSLVSTKIVTTR